MKRNWLALVLMLVMHGVGVLPAFASANPASSGISSGNSSAVTPGSAITTEMAADLPADEVVVAQDQEASGALIETGAINESFLIRLLRGLLGITVLLAVVTLFSAKRRSIDWVLVAKGLGLQIVFALLVLKTTWGRGFFRVANDAFVAVIGYTNSGARFLFGSLVDYSTPVEGSAGAVNIGAQFAFSVLPVIIFFSSLMTLLYYLGVMQKVVKTVAWLMQRTLGTSGAETTSAAGNIFVGQTEAPLLIKPFVKDMTMSELNTVMTGGFATVAGGVLAAYVAMLATYFPSIAGHLLAASIMAAPAGIVVSKILMPETEEPKTQGSLEFELEVTDANAIDAAASGASDGLKLALNVGAMLLAFLALIAMANGLLGWGLGLFGIEGITLERIFGVVFSPVAWIVGVPWADAGHIGSLFGIKMVGNEFIAFQNLATSLASGVTLNPKSVVIATYALTGFANFASIAIQIGGIGGIAPSRRQDLSRLGMRAMLGGTVATWMTATLAGVLS